MPRFEKECVIETYFRLLAEFEEAHIPLERVARTYFGLRTAKAKGRALRGELPCRVFRLGGRTSPWLVSASDLAVWLDRWHERADPSA